MIDARRLNKKIKNLDNCTTIQDKILYSWSLQTEALMLGKIVDDCNSCHITISIIDDFNLHLPFSKIQHIYEKPSLFLDEYIKLLWSNGYVVKVIDGKLTDIDFFYIKNDSPIVKEYYKDVTLKLTW